VRWPWPRSLFAALIASMHQAGAAKFLMDFQFLEPSDGAQDDMLAAYAAGCPETILGRTRDKTPIFWQDDFQKQFPQFAVTNRMGLVDFSPDDDGVYRHYPMAGSLAAKATGKSFLEGRLLLHWYASLGTTNQSLQFPTNQALSAAPFVVLGEQLQRQLEAKGIDDTNPTNIVPGLAGLPPLDESVAAKVRGKIVFVGANASGAVDLKATPVGGIEPGTLVHFTAWADEERNDFIKPFPKLADLIVSLVMVFTVILTGWRHSKVAWMVGIGGAFILILLAGSFLAFRADYFFPPATPVAGVCFALLAGSTHNFWRERRRKREIQTIFGSYVSKQVVDKLLKNPDAIRLGGEKKNLTVFFSDLAGFTDLSEKLPPEELVRVVNRYLAQVTDFILDNGGYVDKYIGDAVMGVFGSPEPLPNHALAACRAALASRDWMAEAFRNAPVKLHARIGLNTGEMIVGNVGSERKMNFTVLGDAVNLASRLEAANKDVGTVILIGEDTEQMVRGEFVTRPIARLRVKGKHQPNQTHELICKTGGANAEQMHFVAAYTEAYKCFLNREFEVARVQFLQALALRPGDRMAQLYLDRAGKFEYEPPTPDWDVLELKSK
jgi:adenylate cyclase